MAEQGSPRRFARIDRLPPYVFNITAELKMAARRRGEDIIDLSMGNPDGATPPHIVEKLVQVAQREDTHGYSTSKGIPRLRRAISRWYKDRYEVDIDPESEAIVTIGSKEGLAHLMLATLDQGDTVLVPNPSYPIHTFGFIIAGATIRSVPTTPDENYFRSLDRAMAFTVPRPSILVVNYPSNPTAETVDLAFYERLVAWAKENKVWILSDLAYSELYYDGNPTPSILQVPGAKDVAIEFTSLSKTYSMAGWRMGFAVGNRKLIAAMTRVKSYLDYGAFTPIQAAACAAPTVSPVAVTFSTRPPLAMILPSFSAVPAWKIFAPSASAAVMPSIAPPRRGCRSSSLRARTRCWRGRRLFSGTPTAG